MLSVTGGTTGSLSRIRADDGKCFQRRPPSVAVDNTAVAAVEQHLIADSRGYLRGKAAGDRALAQRPDAADGELRKTLGQMGLGSCSWTKPG